MEAAQRLRKLPPYLFADIDRKQEELRAKGVDVISLGVGDPDLPTPPHIVEALAEGARDQRTHRYPPYAGTRDFREAVAGWYRRRFNVTLDPEREVLALIGSKEGIGHLPWAIVDPGDVALVSDPGYPVYNAAVILAEGTLHAVPLDPARGFLPDLGAIPKDAARRAKLLFLNYPNNPTAATADPAFFQEVVRFAREHDVLVVHDNSYSEIAYDGYRPPSFLQADGAKEVGIEFHSLSKTFCMTGWRVGFVIGRRDAVAALGQLKTNIDSGVFVAVQHAAVAALDGPQDVVAERVAVFQRRRDLAVDRLRKIGWQAPRIKATFYLWVPVPDGTSSVAFSTAVLERAGVAVTPGIGYGARGEGYVRLSLTLPDERLSEALDRLGAAFGR